MLAATKQYLAIRFYARRGLKTEKSVLVLALLLYHFILACWYQVPGTAGQQDSSTLVRFRAVRLIV